MSAVDKLQRYTELPADISGLQLEIVAMLREVIQ